MNGAQSSWSFRDRCVLAALLITAAVFIALRFGEFPVAAGMDDAYYIEMARSLAEGRGPVIHLNESGPDWRPDIFPFGFPLLLSPLALLLPASLAVFKLVPLLGMAALFPICLMLVRPAGTRRGLLLAALVCLNPWVIAFAVRVFSDLPFTAFSLAAVLLFLKLDSRPRLSFGLLAGTVIVTGAAVMTRSIGLALPAAMIIHWLIQRRWRPAFLFVGALALVLLPHALAGGGTGGGLITGSYVTQVLDGGDGIPGRVSLVAGNLIGYLKELPVVLLPVFGGPLDSFADRAGLGAVLGPFQLFLGMVLVAGIVLGLIATAREDRNRSRFLAIYLVVYGGILLNFAGYPSGVQTRLLLPVVPLLFLLLLTAAARIFSRRHKLFAGSVVGLALALSLGHNVYRSARPLNAGGDFIDPGLGSVWIREHTEPGDVIMARWPLRQHVHFQRPVVGFGEAGDFMVRISRYQVGYVFFDSYGPEAEHPDRDKIILSVPEKFQPVHHDTGAGITIFRVVTTP